MAKVCYLKLLGPSDVVSTATKTLLDDECRFSMKKFHPLPDELKGIQKSENEELYIYAYATEKGTMQFAEEGAEGDDVIDFDLTQEMMDRYDGINVSLVEIIEKEKKDNKGLLNRQHAMGSKMMRIIGRFGAASEEEWNERYQINRGYFSTLTNIKEGEVLFKVNRLSQSDQAAIAKAIQRYFRGIKVYFAVREENCFALGEKRSFVYYEDEEEKRKTGFRYMALHPTSKRVIPNMDEFIKKNTVKEKYSEDEDGKARAAAGDKQASLNKEIERLDKDTNRYLGKIAEKENEGED